MKGLLLTLCLFGCANAKYEFHGVSQGLVVDQSGVYTSEDQGTCIIRSFDPLTGRQRARWDTDVNSHCSDLSKIGHNFYFRHNSKVVEWRAGEEPKFYPSAAGAVSVSGFDYHATRWVVSALKNPFRFWIREIGISNGAPTHSDLDAEVLQGVDLGVGVLYVGHEELDTFAAPGPKYISAVRLDGTTKTTKEIALDCVDPNDPENVKYELEGISLYKGRVYYVINHGKGWWIRRTVCSTNASLRGSVRLEMELSQ